MVKKAKKHTILGGVKVSSNQLSEWGKSGGRPKKYANNSERQRAYKLRKEQKKFGKDSQLRDYYVKKKPVEFKGSLEMICSKCCAEAISSPQRLGGSCYRMFCAGIMGVKRRK